MLFDKQYMPVYPALLDPSRCLDVIPLLSQEGVTGLALSQRLGHGTRRPVDYLGGRFAT